MVDGAALAAPVAPGQPGPPHHIIVWRNSWPTKKAQRQEEAEVQELRRQGAGEEGGQGGEVPEMWRDGGEVSASGHLLPVSRERCDERWRAAPQSTCFV